MLFLSGGVVMVTGAGVCERPVRNTIAADALSVNPELKHVCSIC